MANQYQPYYDNGTFENSFGYPLTLRRFGIPSDVVLCSFQQSAAEAFAGTKSGLFKVDAGRGFLGGVGTNPDQRLAMVAGFRTFPGSLINAISLVAGRKYKFKFKVKTTSANPFGTDNVLIMPFNNSISSTSMRFENLSGDRVRMYITGPSAGGNNLAGFDECIGVKVSGCTDAWVEVEYTFVEVAPAQWNSARWLNLSMYLYKVNEFLPSNPLYVYDLTEGGTVINEIFDGGELYIDGFSIEEVAGCDLQYEDPAYTKTDETAEDADDGSITVHAASSQAIQYSLDDVTYQLSNVFLGLAPGLYNVFVKDVAGCVLPPILNVPILEFTEGPVDPPDPEPPVGTLEVDLTPVNSYNFVTWYKANGLANFANLSYINCDGADKLPKPYRLNKTKGKHFPVVVNDERFSFYINFDKDYSYPNFTSFRLDLVTQYGAVQLAVAPLSRVFQPDGVKYFIYASPILSAVPPGIYRLMIVDTSTDDPYNVRFISQEIRVMTATDAKKVTARFRFRCSISIYRYLYSELPDYFNEIRLRIADMGPDLDGEIEQYRAVTSGMLRNVAYDLDKFNEIETYYFDDLAHDAMFVFCAHDGIFINDIAYLIKQLHKPSWDPIQNCNKGVFQVFEQAFSSANRYGNPNALEVTDPAIEGDDEGLILQ